MAEQQIPPDPARPAQGDVDDVIAVAVALNDGGEVAEPPVQNRG
jgi:hypothetical protein